MALLVLRMVASCLVNMLLAAAVTYDEDTKFRKALSLVQQQVGRIERKSEAQRGGIPHGRKIAVLLRGETFRAQFVGQRHFHKQVCDPRTEELQVNYTKSLVEQVIEPFEAYGNRVQIVSTVHPCALNVKVQQLLGKHSVVFKTVNPDSQLEDVRGVFDIFSQHYGGVDSVEHKLDYVLVVRHDLEWLQDITHWGNDFDRFSFLARCDKEAAPQAGGANCVHDIVHWMPAKFFPSFYATVGHQWEIKGAGRNFPDCKHPVYDCFVEDGHACYYPMVEALQNYSKSAKVSFLSKVRISPKSWNPLVNLGRVGLEHKSIEINKERRANKLERLKEIHEAQNKKHEDRKAKVEAWKAATEQRTKERIERNRGKERLEKESLAKAKGDSAKKRSPKH